MTKEREWVSEDCYFEAEPIRCRPEDLEMLGQRRIETLDVTFEIRESTEEDLEWLAEALGPAYLDRMRTLPDRLAARGKVEEVEATSFVVGSGTISSYRLYLITVDPWWKIPAWLISWLRQNTPDARGDWRNTLRILYGMDIWFGRVPLIRTLAVLHVLISIWLRSV